MNLPNLGRAPAATFAPVLIRLAATLLVASSMTWSTSTLAQGAYFSGPSIARSGTVVVFLGGNFTPNTGYTVNVTAPGGQEAAYSTVSNANGELRFEFSISVKGEYSMRVTGTRRNSLAEAKLIASEASAGS